MSFALSSWEIMLSTFYSSGLQGLGLFWKFYFNWISPLF